MQEDNSIAAFVFAALTVGVVLFLVLGLKPFRAFLKSHRHVVEDYQTALRVRDGKAIELVGPGVYTTFLTNDRLDLHDMRERRTVMSLQEMLTADRLTVKVSLTAVWRIVDPMALRQMPSGVMFVVEALQAVLREQVAPLTLEEILTDRTCVARGASEALAARIRQFGMEVISVEVRDLALAGPARQAYADLWKAEMDAKIALEKARGEQASLRALANAARMLKGNPELMNLRLLQALAGAQGKPGPTIVLGGGTGLQPVGPAAPPSTAEDDA